MVFFYVFVLCCVCASVVAMPSIHNTVEPIENEVQSYNFSFVRRDEWLAKTPKKKHHLLTPVPFVVIHHSYEPTACYDRQNCCAAMRNMQDLHMDGHGWWDIGYHFAVGGDGAAYEGRGWKTRGAHALHFNSVSIGICLIGDWRYDVPPAQQLKTTIALINAGVELGFIKSDYKLVGHRQVRNTECPGDALYGEIKNWDHYSPFPNATKDLLDIKEIPDDVKELIRGSSTVTA